MKATLNERLNEILPRITSETLLSNEGIGNEIACYIFDYPAEDELVVRDYLKMVEARLASHHPNLRVLHLNLLEVVLAYLEKRGLYQKTLKMEAAKGSGAILRALKGPLAAEKLCHYIAQEYNPTDYQLVLMSGVGSAWPMLRAHSLLNCLHTVMEKTPLVMFYPGTFDGTTLRLFGQIETQERGSTHKPYYRAFLLVPGGTTQ